jgi:hypothetical protein
MRTCKVCGARFTEEEITCPGCKAIMARFLTRPNDYPDMEEVTVHTVKALEERWAFNPFAAGWRIVDVVGRITLALVVLWLAFAVQRTIRTHASNQAAQLASHRDALASGLGSRDVDFLAESYSRLIDGTQALASALEFNGTLIFAVLLGLMGLLATSAVSSYREYKELDMAKATLRFLCTERGRAFVGGVLVQLALANDGQGGPDSGTPAGGLPTGGAPDGPPEPTA